MNSDIKHLFLALSRGAIGWTLAILVAIRICMPQCDWLVAGVSSSLLGLGCGIGAFIFKPME